ncbi:hypothetical protein [Azoarcus sp. KH32C]|uniref:hypothetical protein n=1 Tax=Azoarcus sp. KH32C TaxID=748247 RepID=UPI00023866F7|nr:hypothetical protein [Azoarcus sp. KH32C]BAL23697.1 hypothetical protein AZKH_1375 [Azoarcus sp. KH32C]
MKDLISVSPAALGTAVEPSMQGEPRLMALLRAEAMRRGDSISYMAKVLGVTHGYISLLSSGRRQVENVSPAFIANCAAYLAVAPIVVKLAAGIVELGDFVDHTAREDVLLQRLFSDVRRDPEFGAVWPGGEEELSREQRRFVAYCYLQAMMNCVVMPRDDANLFRIVGECLGGRK